MSDSRFARLKSDPRFRRLKKHSNKVIVDERFKSVFDAPKKKKNGAKSGIVNCTLDCYTHTQHNTMY